MPSSPSPRAPLLVLSFSVLLLFTSALYLIAFWGLPSDGTIVDLSARPAAGGLIVHSLRPGSALQTGDEVVAVDGLPIDAWLSSSLRRPLAAVEGAALDYTVQRAGQAFTVRQPLQPTPLADVLAQNWTTYFFLVYLLGIAFFVFVRRPHLHTARMLLFFSSCLVTSTLMFFLGLPLSGLRYGWLVSLWVWGAIVVYGFLAGSGIYFTTIFPRPWPGLEHRRAWPLLIFGGAWLPLIAHVLWGWGPAGGAAARLALLVRSSSTMSVAVFPLAVLGSVISYRLTTSEVGRRQVRWILWALMVSILPWVVLTALPQALGLPSLLPPLVVGLLWCALPTAFAISILREGLFDIDVIINRSLVYGALTLVLAVAYFGGIVVLQSVFQAITGEQQSQLATVLSTLTIAALFSPLRQRLQRAVDRRFYRRKYDAARTLAAFGASLRDEVDLSTLTQRLVGAVHETMQPAQAWLWLRPGGRVVASPTGGTPAREAGG